MQRAALIAVLALIPVASAAAGLAQELRFETRDWVLTAPSEIGTEADLALTGRAVQICTDEVKKLLGHRPTVVAKFTMQWVPSALGGAGATRTGVFNRYTPGFRLFEPATKSFRESLVARGLCFRPHEITHVLSWDSFRIAWAQRGVRRVHRPALRQRLLALLRAAAADLIPVRRDELQPVE